MAVTRESYQRPAVSPVVATLFAAGLVRPSHRILDAGCGTGTDALALASWGARRVVGVDWSEAALSIARGRATRRGFARRVRFVSGNVRSLDKLFPQARFDVALDTLLINNLDDAQAEEYGRALARVLAPGALVAVQQRVMLTHHRRGRDAVSLPSLWHDLFEFGPGIPTLLPEPPRRPGAPPAARVVIFVGRAP